MKRQHLIAVAVALAVLLLEFLGAFERTDEKLADRMLRARGEVTRPPRSVALVGVTDDCLQVDVLGPWPWKPAVHTKLIETLITHGAAGILWDLPLPKLTPGDKDGTKLAMAIATAGNVILPVSAQGSTVSDDGAGRLRAPAVVEPDPELTKACAGLGHVQIQADPDGLVRGLVPVLSGPQMDYASLPLLGLARRVMAPGETPPLTPEGLAAKLDVVPDRRGRLRLKWYGPTAFEELPYSEVLGGAIDRSAFEGRIVIVGSASLNLHAQFPTPSGRLERMLVLTTAVANGLEGQFQSGLPAWGIWLLLASFVLLGTRLVDRFGAGFGVALGVIALGAYGALAFWAYTERARLLPLTGAACALGGAALAPTLAALGVRIARRLRARPWAAITGFAREGPLVELAAETLGPGYGSLSLLGAGGMGFVVKAVRLSDQRQVAVKLLAPQLADQLVERERFEREVQLLSALPHPGIVRLLSWDLTGLPHYAMELVVGVSLSERLKTGPFSLPDVAKVVVPLAEALAFAHAHHCVHRDVKPANVLVDDLGVVKLIDFGAAARFDSALAESAAGIAGTPDYMAPEALASSVSPKLDVFALGLLVYELLTGTLPYPRGLPVEARAGLPIEPLTARVPKCPSAVAAAVMAALAPDPAARPATPADLVAALTPHRRA
jgi:CHASE2 domain-containing sensor protein